MSDELEQVRLLHYELRSGENQPDEPPEPSVLDRTEAEEQEEIEQLARQRRPVRFRP